VFFQLFLNFFKKKFLSAKQAQILNFDGSTAYGPFYVPENTQEPGLSSRYYQHEQFFK
jgi:hypothetical protein